MKLKKSGVFRNIEFVRPQELAKDIVIVDGMSSSGKALISPLLSTLRRGELWQLDHLLDFLCPLDFYNKISRNAAAALLKTYADFHLYNLMISHS